MTTIKNRTLFTGDNLDIMRGMNSEVVDLIYLDPPFNSNRNYKAPIGSKAADKITSGKYDKVVYREGKTKVALPDFWDIPIINSMAKETHRYSRGINYKINKKTK